MLTIVGVAVTLADGGAMCATSTYLEIDVRQNEKPRTRTLSFTTTHVDQQKSVRSEGVVSNYT